MYVLTLMCFYLCLVGGRVRERVRAAHRPVHPARSRSRPLPSGQVWTPLSGLQRDDGRRLPTNLLALRKKLIFIFFLSTYFRIYRYMCRSCGLLFTRGRVLNGIARISKLFFFGFLPLDVFTGLVCLT